MTSAEQNRLERRSGQRFSYQIPVLLHNASQNCSGAGCTQDLSSRGAFVLTDFPAAEGDFVEMTLVMPSEITLAEDMKVRCHARVVRREAGEDRKPAIAVRIERYEFMHSESPIIHEDAASTEQTVRS